MLIGLFLGRGAASVMWTGYTAGVGDFQRVCTHDKTLYPDCHGGAARVVSARLSVVLMCTVTVVSTSTP